MSGTNKVLHETGASVEQTDADLMIDVAAGVVAAEYLSVERRGAKRYPFQKLVAVAPVDEAGGIYDACALNGRNISVGGICLTGRTVFAPGTRIIMQLVRSDGSTAVVGGRVQHCRYIGDMQHETGILFTPLPPNLDPQSLIDDDGNLRALHPKVYNRTATAPQHDDVDSQSESDGA